MEKRVSRYVVLGVLVWAIMGTIVAGYYFTQYDTYHEEYANLVEQLSAYNNAINGLAEQLAASNSLVEQLGGNISDISSILDGISVRVDILLSYGNGSKTWHNGTVLPLGSTAYTGVYSIATEINHTDYGGELGILVTSINGVTQNSTHGWFYWHWDDGNSMWVLPSYSSAKHILHKGDVIAFAYASFFDWPPAPPT